MKKIRCIALLSGGLDSKLAIKLIQLQGVDVIALYFLLPFSSSSCTPEHVFNFAQSQNIKLHVIDCTKGKMFQEYITIIKKPKHGYGSAINPCIDCRIFMLKKVKALMSKFKTKFIVTGEVLNERPMSQTRSNLMLIEKEAGLENKILRPLSAKLLPATEAERLGVDRNKLLDIQGKSRKRQIELAAKYRLSYPTPAGGCLLCEKEFAKKLFDLFRYQKKIHFKDIEMLKIGRHFRYGKNKIIVGRNKQENKMLIKLKNPSDIAFEVKGWPSPITLLQGKINKKAIEIAAGLTAFYSDVKNEKEVIVNYGKRKFNKLLKISPLNKKTIQRLRL